MTEVSKAHVVIFGATGGIGSTLVALLRQQDYLVTAVGRDETRLAELAAQTQCGFDVIQQPADFERLEQVIAMANSVSPVSAVVNCLGSVWLKPASATSESDWYDLVSLHLSSCFGITRAVAKKIRQPCKVVFFSSAAAQTGMPNHEAISAVKGGIEGLVRSAAATYARRQLSFFAVAPGMVETGATAHLLTSDTMKQFSAAQHPLGRIGQPMDVAQWVAAIISPQLQWSSGMVLPVDGGLAHLRTLPRK
jgi:3-oxoacyl-[acyl-carrier protein] reductase